MIALYQLKVAGCILPAKKGELLPGQIMVAMEKVAQDEQMLWLIFLQQILQNGEVGLSTCLGHGQACLTEMRHFAQVYIGHYEALPGGPINGLFG